MFLIGLTGSIGMGKTQTAALFEAEGVPRYDADAAVHALYEKGGAAVAPIGALVPEAIVDGAVDRGIPGQAVLKDADKLKQLEQIVHPLAGKSQMAFFAEQEQAKAEMVLLDIPLLFETGGDGFVDTVVVVSAPAELQRQRADKRARAEFVVDTSISVEDAHRQVRDILTELKGREAKALAARIARMQNADK